MRNNSFMGPTDVIRTWFESETFEIQTDIAFLMLGSLEDGDALMLDHDDLIAEMVKWLTPEGETRFRTVGKAVSFIAVFDLIFGNRFAADGWERPKMLFEASIQDAPSASIKETALRMLEEIPSRAALWAEIGLRWNAVKTKLTPDWMESWALTRR